MGNVFSDDFGSNDGNETGSPSSLVGGNIFPMTFISLSQICEAFSVPKNMGALNNKNYYDSDGNTYTIKCSPGNPFSLNSLLGKYSSLTTATYNLRSFGRGWRFSSTGRGGGGIEANTEINSISTIIIGTKVRSVKFDLFFTAHNAGGSIGAHVKDESCNIILSNGTSVPCSTSNGTQTVIVNSNTPIKISASCRGKNNWPGGESQFATANATLNS